jgi:hypothetical protein
MRRITRRWRSAAALLAIVGVSVALLVAAYAGPLTQFGEVLINLGASFLGVVLTVLAIEPIIRRSQQPEEIVRSSFPYEAFLNGVERASYKVRILGAWPYVMDQPWRQRFLAAIEGAAHRRVRIEILVLDPASKAAEQREDDLGGQFDVAAVIGDVLRSLRDLEAKLSAVDRDYLDVRVYATLPPARMYRWDARVISSFFPMGNAVGGDVKHYETSAMSRLAQFVDEQFELLWRDDTTRTLDDYLEVTLVLGGRRHLAAHYVTMDGDVFVESPKLTTPNGAVSIRTREGGRIPFADEDARFTLVPVPDDDDRRPEVLVSFRNKYGPADRLAADHSTIYELTPPA